jgi:pimeloyl-ACP methyl ester carboxylesterase
MPANKIVCISPPTDFMYLVDRFSRALHLPEKVKANLIARFKKQFGEDLAERIAATTTSQVLGHIPALIIHDEDDHDVPITQSENLHLSWPNSRFTRTRGLGHRRILYDARVIEETVGFLQ